MFKKNKNLHNLMWRLLFYPFKNKRERDKKKDKLEAY